MFGCFSSVSFSASGSVFLNGQEYPLILYVQQDQEILSETQTSLYFVMTIQQNPIVVL
jgi:hypothetical protein